MITKVVFRGQGSPSPSNNIFMDHKKGQLTSVNGPRTLSNWIYFQYSPAIDSMSCQIRNGLVPKVLHGTFPKHKMISNL